MSSNEDSNGGNSPQFSGFGYAIGFSTGIIALLFGITISAYICHRTTTNHNGTATAATTDQDSSVASLERYIGGGGLDEETLNTYPKLLYSKARLQKPDINSSCSICLGEYKDADVLRLLPDCGHVFHLNCVDPWLRMHPTCPVCRKSPVPSPLSTPLAEVAPLAMLRV